MSSFESFSKKSNERQRREEMEPATIDDFADTPVVQNMLRRLPVELQSVHATRMADMPEEDAFSYIHSLLERRESAMRESVVSDEHMAPYFHAHEAEIWKDLETSVFTDTDNFLGAGQTAKIKEYDMQDGKGNEIPIAVKYLLTPTEKTLSVSGEHDLIREVERVRAIEEVEKQLVAAGSHIRVPHPYFYYKNAKTQCYGMERIDGINLLEGIEGEYDESIRTDLRAAFAGFDREVIEQEIQDFFDAMHTICLHGDIKPANIMVSRQGTFYVIDFGQSVLSHEIGDKDRDAFEVLKQDEKDGTKSAITRFLNALES